MSSRGRAPAPSALAVTRQAFKDLGFTNRTIINARLERRDPVDLVDEHPVIADFVALRAQCYEGQEPTLNVRPTTWNLHTGTWRSVTWYDADQDVCWLLACSAMHDYDEFVSRSRSSTLLPTADDYIAFADRHVPRDDFLDIAVGQADELLALAESKPGVEHMAVLGNEIDMSLYRQALDDSRSRLWVRYKVPPRGVKDLSDDLATIMAALFFDGPDVTWWATSHPARPEGLSHRDVVIHWTTPGPRSNPSG
jgi:hypothetical protein